MVRMEMADEVAGPIQGKGLVVGSVDQVGAGVVRSALGNDLDGSEHILESLDNGGNEHVNSGSGAHGTMMSRKIFHRGT